MNRATAIQQWTFRVKKWEHRDGKQTKTTLRSDWVDFLDGLCRDGEITDKQRMNWDQPRRIK